MQLYTAGPSPFARKARVAILEMGLTDQVEMVAAMGTPINSANMPVSENPLGKIPCLTRDDGPAIYDSRVITRYLDDLGGGKLYPTDKSLWEVLTLEATADGIMDAAVLMVYEKRVRPEELVYGAWLNAQWGKIERSLDAIEDRWMGQLTGPLNMAQIGIGIALEYLDFRHDDRNWRIGRDALSNWQIEFAKRDAMQATQPDL
jgi:glutathione S-transferase